MTHPAGNSKPAQGVVTELVRQNVQCDYVWFRSADDIKVKKKYLFRTQVQFITQIGRTIHFIARIASRSGSYNVGEPVEVFYNPDNPQQAQINSFLHLWFYVLMLIFFGLFILGMGILGLTLRNGTRIT